MNEYDVFTHEDGSHEEGVLYIQLAYAPYAALLAALIVTSLLGVGTRGEEKQGIRFHLKNPKAS
jgi:hypothetical protein